MNHTAGRWVRVRGNGRNKGAQFKSKPVKPCLGHGVPASWLALVSLQREAEQPNNQVIL